ncbi:MAG: hypothetical protein WC208_10495 [Gallionella sp.]|jgi:hypothetical protein
MNRKGFVIEGVLVIWAIVALTIGAVAFFQGPNLVKAVTGSDRNSSKQTLESSEKYTMGRLDDKGNFVKVGDYDKKLKTLNITAEKPPETWWEKFWHLGIMAVIIIILLTIAFSTPIGKLIWNVYVRPKFAQLETDLQAKQDALDKKTASQDLLHSQAADMVQAIDAGLKTYDSIVAAYTLQISTEGDATKKAHLNDIVLALTTAKKSMMDSFSKEMDSDTKALVGVLKQAT